MASAIATLLDWSFEPLAYDRWVDPTGCTWQLDYETPSCISLVKEVLQHFFLQRIWSTSRGSNLAADPSTSCSSNTGSGQPFAQFDTPRPSTQIYQELAKEYKMNKDHRKLYFLEAIAQGAMDVHTEVHLSYDLETHAVKCSKCGGTVAGNSAWEHFALECPFTISRL